VLINYPHELHGTGFLRESKGNLYWLILQPPSPKTEFLGMLRGNGNTLYENIVQIPSRQFRLKFGSQKNLERIFALFSETKFDETKLDKTKFDKTKFDETKSSIDVEKSPKESFQKLDSLFVMNVRNYLLRFLLDVVESGQLCNRVVISEDIQQAINQIKTNDETFFTMKQLARVSGLSESRFKHRFKEETGTTPADYQLRYKIDCACKMLIQDNLSILNTALSLGFSSSQYFATVFRRYMGLPPAEYRIITKSPERQE
jgi:AraC-like DNA-binding protein